MKCNQYKAIALNSVKYGGKIVRFICDIPWLKNNLFLFDIDKIYKFIALHGQCRIF